MRLSRRLILSGLAIVAALMLGFWFMREREVVNWGLYAQVQRGMTEVEVDALFPLTFANFPYGPNTLAESIVREPQSVLQGRTGFTSKFRPDGTADYIDDLSGKKLATAKFWCGKTHQLVVVFDENGRVDGKELYKVELNRWDDDGSWLPWLWSWFVWLRVKSGL